MQHREWDDLRPDDSIPDRRYWDGQGRGRAGPGEYRDGEDPGAGLRGYDAPGPDGYGRVGGDGYGARGGENGDDRGWREPNGYAPREHAGPDRRGPEGFGRREPDGYPRRRPGDRGGWDSRRGVWRDEAKDVRPADG